MACREAADAGLRFDDLESRCDALKRAVFRAVNLEHISSGELVITSTASHLRCGGW